MFLSGKFNGKISIEENSTHIQTFTSHINFYNCLSLAILSEPGKTVRI